MDNEIEDLVGDVKYTDSQKSVATSNLYSMDFTDSSSDKYNSTGKTYVIELDESDDSEKYYNLHENQSVLNLNEKAAASVLINVETETFHKITKSTSTSFQKCAVAQEIYTQTSKTIIELAEKEGLRKSTESKTLETQTSLLSITENKTLEYRIQLAGAKTTLVQYDDHMNIGSNDPFYLACNEVCNYMDMSLDDASSKFATSTIENEKTDDPKSETSSNDKGIGDDPTNDSQEENQEISNENNSFLDQSVKSDSDIEEDSLMCNEYDDNKSHNPDIMSDTSEVPKSIDSDIEDLYKKLSEKIQFKIDRPLEPGGPRFNPLTPLTEEPVVRKESILDVTPIDNNIVDTNDADKYVLFVNDFGMKVKVLSDDETPQNDNGKEILKLPPLNRNQSCPPSPHLNFMFSGATQQQIDKNCFQEGHQKDWFVGDRWEIGTKDLAAGESPLISDPVKKPLQPIQLPPIHADGNTKPINGRIVPYDFKTPDVTVRKDLFSKQPECISIKDKIKELKMSNNNLRYWPQQKYSINSTSESRTSRSPSPESPTPEDSRLGDVAERGCESLCQELLKRLRSNSWFEVSDTMEELPRVMEKFWGVIAENRIADLIRQVSCHVDSPRTQVARNACSTLAAILKNTNYTKKPDFYEAVTSLLVKTGSFSRPVRRAANVALDAVVCGVELPHAVTALCIHGTSHKNPLVRCASARLMVVCCALAGGGRELLRTRPPSAVCARRHALRSLAALLEDKNTDTRKYAERLYSMLRPLSNFEAFYLTDVEVEVATRQMKKFDQVLLCGPPREHR